MMPEEMKLERLQGIQNYVTGELRDNETEILVSYYLTSIHDHSALEAFSKVSTVGRRRMDKQVYRYNRWLPYNSIFLIIFLFLWYYCFKCYYKFRK